MGGGPQAQRLAQRAHGLRAARLRSRQPEDVVALSVDHEVRARVVIQKDFKPSGVR